MSHGTKLSNPWLRNDQLRNMKFEGLSLRSRHLLRKLCSKFHPQGNENGKAYFSRFLYFIIKLEHTFLLRRRYLLRKIVFFIKPVICFYGCDTRPFCRILAFFENVIKFKRKAFAQKQTKLQFGLYFRKIASLILLIPKLWLDF